MPRAAACSRLDAAALRLTRAACPLPLFLAHKMAGIDRRSDALRRATLSACESLAALHQQQRAAYNMAHCSVRLRNSHFSPARGPDELAAGWDVAPRAARSRQQR